MNAPSVRAIAEAGLFLVLTMLLALALGVAGQAGWMLIRGESFQDRFGAQRWQLVTSPRSDDALEPSDLLASLESRFPEHGFSLAADDPLTLEVSLPDKTTALAPVRVALDQHGYRIKSATSAPVKLTGGLASWIPWLISAQALAFVLVGAVLRRVKLSERPAASTLPRAALPVVGIALGLATLAVSYAVASLLAALGVPAREQSWVGELVGQGALIAVLPWIVLIGPLGEEVFFRGYMFPFLLSRSGAAVAYPVSAVAFAMVHFNPSAFAIYLVIGLLFAAAYARWRSVGLTFTAHAVYNLAVVLISTASGGG